MSSEYPLVFTRTSLYLVRLEIFEWIKLLRRHLHQFQENGAGRNFITASREFTAHYTYQNAEINLKSTTSNGFNFWIINSLMVSWGVRLTWFDCNNSKKWEIGNDWYVLSDALFCFGLFYIIIIIRGCLHDAGATFAPVRVHSDSISWLCICLHDTITKCHAGASHPGVSSPRVVVPGREFHSTHSSTKSCNSIM